MRVWALFPLLVSLSMCQMQPARNQVCLLVPPDVEECYRRFQGKPIDARAAQINCLQKLLWNFPSRVNLSQADVDYFRSLVSRDWSRTSGVGMPPSGRRVRREYRLLTARERHRLHAALNKLYEDGTVARFARLHATAADWHYNGPSFLPWNRAFLAMFEEALRRHDNTVSLPYWDSSIDNAMDNPVNSVIWTPEYFGSGVGDVVDGPAAEWLTNLGRLERNYGRRSRLLSKEQIRDVLSQCNLRDISKPYASRHYDLEYHHGGPHIWTGGDMQAVASSAFDPVFYMHHAFVDYIWELFRRRQYRRCGVDPAYDYPDLPRGDIHHGDARMIGLDWLTNRDGIKYEWVDHWYDYESTPSCPNCCEGCSYPAPVYCDRVHSVCVARSRRSFAFGTSDRLRRLHARLDPREMHSLIYQRPPRNRGVEYQAPTSDGRTLLTAVEDTYLFLQNQENMSTIVANLGAAVSANDPLMTEYREPQPEYRQHLLDGQKARQSVSGSSAGDLQMVSRISQGRSRILSKTVSGTQRRTTDTRGPSVYRSLPTSRSETRILDSFPRDRPISMSDAPVKLTDIHEAIPGPQTLSRSTISFMGPGHSFPDRTRSRVNSNRPSFPGERLQPDTAADGQGLTNLRMSSFDLPAPTSASRPISTSDAGTPISDRGISFSDPLVSYANPEMSLYERRHSFVQSVGIPDGRASSPVRRRDYVNGQITLPDPRKNLISRPRRLQPDNSMNVRTVNEPRVIRSRNTFNNGGGLSDRTTSFGGQYANFV